MKKDRAVPGLLLLQAFNGLSGILGGAMLLKDPTGADLDMKLAWLRSTPFSDYLIPGVVLFGAIGLGQLFGFMLTIRRHAAAGGAAVGLGAILMGWIGFQMIWIGYKSLLQPLYFLTGLGVLVLGCLRISQKRKEKVSI
jgi:hypothetical protein